MKTGICIKPLTPIYKEAPFPIEDEICMGWAVIILSQDRDRYRIRTHYGYEGYVSCEDILISEVPENRKLHVITKPLCDVMSQPDVTSRLLITLPAGSFVEIIDDTEDDGYCLIKTADGTQGYVPCIFLTPRKDSDGFLFTDDQNYFRNAPYPDDEQAIRDRIVKSAGYFTGVQYRWGGKSGSGIDCSGLAFMSYMLAGILIYRDADIRDDYPIRPITRQQLKKGDLLFFPGHVAIYLGNGRYIHSTAHSKSFGVTVNSLNPHDEDYRQDLDELLTECGSVFQAE